MRPRRDPVPPPGDDVELLVLAYRQGLFPMADPETGEIHFYSPDPRGIIPLEGFRIRPSLARVVRRGEFDIRCDTAFEAVMRNCATSRFDEDKTWINEHLIALYVELFRRGQAHSMEAWRDGRLVGGLYGVHLGAAFFGESMFHRPDLGGTNASKVCLVHLVRWLKHRGFTLLDTQFHNDHLAQFGCIEIPREDYLRRLARALNTPIMWGEFISPG